ncbi:MAG TPA: phosphoribosyltransferase family protein [Candidatus Saccharimonadales bacterium]|nr:phosphoribosyltransferase family protein [Candidatus Saccharimonadales bacterium]
MTEVRPGQSIADFRREHGGYEMLVGHNRTDGTFKPDEELRTEYIQNTDKLIYEMTNGVVVTDPVTGETSRQKPDYVVWLDKSARPLAWLTKELWDRLAPSPGEEPPKMPEFRFVNIDREQWVNKVDPMGVGTVEVDRVDKNIIRSLRSIFVDVRDKKNGLTEEIDTAPAQLDGKTVLIVDECMTTGRTLDYAKAFFGRAFPTAKIAGTYWMSGVTMLGPTWANADLPVWYVSGSEYGRGVGNREPYRSQKSPSITQRLGGHFLSTRLAKSDEGALKLRQELKKLAHDKNVLIVPSGERIDDPDYELRATALNGLKRWDAFLKRKQKLNAIVKNANNRRRSSVPVTDDRRRSA